MQIQSVLLGASLIQNLLTYWFLSGCRVRALGLVQFSGQLLFTRNFTIVVEEIEHARYGLQGAYIRHRI